MRVLSLTELHPIPKFDIAIERLAALRQSAWAGAGIACVLFLAALGARFALGDALGPFPFLTFFPAIIVTALLGGVRPAIGVTLVAAATAWYFFIPPFNSWTMPTHGIVGIVFFLLVASLDIVLIEMLHRVVQRLHRERARASALIDAREAMFKELQHRVANNMQFVAGLLAMQQRAVHDTEAGKVLEEAGARLRAMSRIHRRLYDPANADRPFGPLVEELCHELLEATGAKNIVCRVSVPAGMRMPLDRVLALSLITTEALTNVVKHAFPDGEPGTISIALEPQPDQTLNFVVADDGRGMPESFDATKSPSLGMRILHALAQQLGGELSYGRAVRGSVLRLRFSA